MGRGFGLGKVLRPRQPRCTDGASGAEGEGRTGAEANPTLSESGIDGRRSDECANRRDAARRTTSPLLSNILLTDLDRELEKRGHRFCRYADDCNIYVGSQRGGRRVMAEGTRLL